MLILHGSGSRSVSDCFDNKILTLTEVGEIMKCRLSLPDSPRFAFQGNSRLAVKDGNAKTSAHLVSSYR